MTTNTNRLIATSANLLASAKAAITTSRDGADKVSRILESEKTIRNKNAPYKRRLLSESEIDDIVGVIGFVPTRIHADAEALRSKQCDIVRSELKGKLVNDHPDIVVTIKQRLRESWIKGVMTPGTPLGTGAGDDLGAAIMQSTLNTKHKPGSKQNASGGLADQREVLMLRDRTKPALIVGFEQPQSFRSIMGHWRPKWVETRVSSFVLHHRHIKLFRLDVEPEWWTSYRAHHHTAERTPKYVLELQLDRQQLFNYQVSLEQIKAAIIAATTLADRPLLDIYYTPLVWERALLHIGVNLSGPPDADSATHTASSFDYADSLELTFFERHYFAWLRSKVSGIDGVKFITPIATKVMDAIRDEQVNDNLATITLKRNVKRFYGVDESVVAALAIACGLNVTSTDPHTDSIVVALPKFSAQAWLEKRISHRSLPGLIVETESDNGRTRHLKCVTSDIASEIVTLLTKEKIRASSSGPHVTIDVTSIKASAIGEMRSALLRDLEERTSAEEARRAERIATGRVMTILSETPTPIEAASTSWMAELGGGSLRTILREEGVNNKISFSNNAREMGSIFGIRAARNFLIMELQETWSNSGAPLQPVSIHLVADAMTYSGSLTPSSSHGITSTNIGFLSKMAVHWATKWMSAAALNGEVDNLNGCVSAMMVGKRNKLGVGIVSAENTTPPDTPFDSTNVVSDAAQPIVFEYVTSTDD